MLKNGLKTCSLLGIFILGLLLCFPPFNLGLLAWGCFLPFFLSLQNIRYRYLIFIFFPLFFFSNGLLLFWLWEVSPQVYFICITLFAFFSLPSVFFVKYLLNRKLYFLIPGILVLFEFLRSLGPYGFPFLVLAYTQHNYPALIQTADLGGVWLVSFFIYLVNLLLFLYFKNKNKKYLFQIIIVFCGLLVYGLFFQEKISGQVKVGLIQPNRNMFLSQWSAQRRDFLQDYLRLSELALKEKPDLLLWPETSIGVSLRKDRQAAKEFRQIIDHLQVDLLIGNVDEKLFSLRFKEKYNTAMYIAKNGQVRGLHQKTKLIPFLELINYQMLLPLTWRDKLPTGYYLKGQSSAPLNTGAYRAAVVICFEAVFGDLVRSITSQKANIIYNLSSDGWSRSRTEHEQNFMVNIFRAVENRLYLVRVSDNGISAIISPQGHIIKQLPAFTRGTLVEQVPLLNNYSFYARCGDLFIYLLLLTTIFFLIRSYLERDK